MNLVIDIGNSSTKYAIFKEEEMLAAYTIDNGNLLDIIAYAMAVDNIKAVLLSAVISNFLTLKLITELHKKYFFIELNATTPLPLKNLYETPNTLGMDRLAVVVGANSIFKNNNVLVIDAGTFIKYDFINQQNEYLGGGISLGIDMRFKALHNYTDKLPLIMPETFNELIGRNTRESILSGVQQGILAEVSGIVAVYEAKFEHLKVVLTGGSMRFFESHLKNSIFARPFILLNGLNIILNHNRILKNHD